MSEKVVDVNTEMRYDVVEYSIEVFVEEVVSRVKDGWVPVAGSGDCIPMLNTYTVTMIRDKDTVAALKALGESITAAPKLTRAEILQKAREAKADKAAKSDAQATLDVSKITQ
jgi:hypothetical protein